jgi:alkylation response protein AidB-like acyl-CoA dehydrogenase
MRIPFTAEVGADGALLPYAIAVEELTRVDSSAAMTPCPPTSASTLPIHRLGSEEQKQRNLPEPGG